MVEERPRRQPRPRLETTPDAPPPSRIDGVLIRRAHASEYPALGELTRAAYEHDYTVSDEYRRDLVHPELRAEQYELWLAVDRDTGALLGTVSTLLPGLNPYGRLEEGEAYFRLLGVAPEARRRRVGEALTLFTVDLARRRGQHTVVMNSGPDMLGAHALYAKLGFTRQPHRETEFVVDGRTIRGLTFALPVVE